MQLDGDLFYYLLEFADEKFQVPLVLYRENENYSAH